MRLFKIILLLFAGNCVLSNVSGQGNAYINVLTQNSGVVNIGGNVFIEVVIGNSGPVDDIPAGKLRVQVSVPGSITGIPATGHVLPGGWTILSNSGTSIQVCNSSDIIHVFEDRTILINVQGNNIGGPSTIIGQLDFRNNCSAPGSLNGDDASDNSSTTTIQVIPVCSLTVTASAGTILCNGGTTTLTATVANASGGIEYSLNNGPFQGGNTFTVNAAGSPYTVTAREIANNACTATSSPVIVNQPPLLASPSVNLVHPTCTVATGTITITSVTAGLTFSLDGGTYATYPVGGYVVTPGAHILTAQNANGCVSAVTNITINAQPATPAAPAVNVAHPTCAVATGTIAVTSSTTGLTFSLDGGVYAAYPTAGYIVAAGLHTLTAKNTDGCISAVTNTTINAQPLTPAAPAVDVMHPTCTVATGTITITSSIMGLIFSLDGGIYAAYPTGGYIVAAGLHTLTAKNADGCISAVTNVVINAQPAAPAAPTTGIITQPTCAVSSGSVVLNGLPAGNWTINPGAVTGSGASVTISTLAPGTYNFTVTNSAGCISAMSADIVINVVPGAPAAPVVNVIQPTCTVPTGIITVTSSTVDLIFSLDGGPYATYPAGGYTVTAGPHTLTSQNTALCISPVTHITINAQPPTPAAPAVDVVHPTCTVATGTITVTSSTAGLTFSFDGGAYTAYPAGGYIASSGPHTLLVQNAEGCISPAANITVNAQPVTPAAPAIGSIAQPTCMVTGSVVLNNLPAGNWVINPGSVTGNTSSATITNLIPGVYNYAVTNEAGCTSALSANVVMNVPAGTPAAPAISIVHPSCTIATGIITVTSSTNGLTFSLDGGTFTAYPAGGYIVAAGLHTLRAKNTDDCISDVTGITINAQPATPAAPTVSMLQPTCTIATGAITITSITTGLTFSLDGGAYTAYPTGGYIVAAGSLHILAAQNAEGCISAVTNVTINAQPVTPGAPVVDIMQPGCNTPAGTITVTSSTTGLTFSLDGGAYTAYPSGGYMAATGSHTLTAQNNDGCVSPVTDITINVQPSTPAAPVVTLVHPTCAVATGTITVTSETAGLTFSLDGGAYATYPSGGYIAAAGSHTLTSQNAEGCISPVATIIINTQPPTPVATVSADAIACFGGMATMTVTASGGTGALEYSLDGINYQPENTFSVEQGLYTINVRDENLCTATAVFDLAQPPVISASASAGTIDCNSNGGTIIIAASGGTGLLQYSLNGGAYQPGNTFIVNPGTYTVTVRDANNCTASTSSVTVMPLPAIKAVANAGGGIAQCGGTTMVRVTASGGVTPYSSGTGEFVRGPGEWSFIVKDARGCADTAEIFIEPPGCAQLHIYPNPAINTDIITVNHSAAAPGSFINIYNVNGQLVKSQAVPQNAFQTTMDVSRLAAASYVLVYRNGNEKKAALFVKIVSK